MLQLRGHQFTRVGAKRGPARQTNTGGPDSLLVVRDGVLKRPEDLATFGRWLLWRDELTEKNQHSVVLSALEAVVLLINIMEPLTADSQKFTNSLSARPVTIVVRYIPRNALRFLTGSSRPNLWN